VVWHRERCDREHHKQQNAERVDSDCGGRERVDAGTTDNGERGRFRHSACERKPEQQQ
jgi:hypothetical protein